MTKLLRCAVAILALALVGVGLGVAKAHQTSHKPWSKLTTEQKIAVVNHNVTLRSYKVAFWRNLPRRVSCSRPAAQRGAPCGLTQMQRAQRAEKLHRHTVALRRARRTLARLLWLAANSGPVPWYWNNLHNCEQPGSWQNGGGPRATFSGGLGIHRDVWGQIAGRLGLPGAAWDATPWQQIAVARVIMRDYGAGAWAGCAPKAQAVMNQEGIA